MSRTVGDGLSDLRGKLAAAGIESSAREARRIMAAALGVAPDRVSLMQTDPLPHAAEDRLSGMAARRCAREPLAHILGLRAFYRHEFRVTRHVLDPRPETEVLVEAGLGAPFERVLDLGTGTGCILLSLLAARPGAEGTGTDISEEALAVARENTQNLGVADRCNLLKSDWFSAVEGQFDLIVSNPPYIALDEMAGLAPELREWEPALALTDGGDGLSAYRVIAAGAPARLAEGGHVLVEIGAAQAPAVTAIFEESGAMTQVIRDLDGRDRVIKARFPAK